MILQKNLLNGVNSQISNAIESMAYSLGKFYRICLYKGHFDDTYGTIMKNGKGVMFTIEQSAGSYRYSKTAYIQNVIEWMSEAHPDIKIDTIAKNNYDLFVLTLIDKTEKKKEKKEKAIDKVEFVDNPESVVEFPIPTE